MDSVVMARGGERCWIHKGWFYAVGGVFAVIVG